MARKFPTWRAVKVARLKDDPESTSVYLNTALEESQVDGDWGAFMEAVRTVADTQGGLGELAKKMKCSRTTLYRTLSTKGNPRMETLAAIFRALGFQIVIRAIVEKKSQVRKKKLSSRRSNVSVRVAA